MQIRFTETVAAASDCYRRGREYAVADAEATSHIRNGVAVAVEQPAVTAEQPKPVKTPRKRKPKPEAQA